MNRYEKKVVAITTSGHALAHFYEQAYPAVLMLISREFGLGLAEAGELGNIFPLFLGIGSLPAGFIIDRYGSRRVLLAYLCVCAAAAVGVLFLGDVRAIVVLLAVMGLFAGLYHPSGATLISYNVRQIGSALGIQGMGGNLGLAVAPLMLALIASFLGWRASYAVLAVPACALAFIIYRNKGLDSNRITMELIESEKTVTEKPAPAPQKTTLWKPLIALFMVSLLNGFCYRGLITFFPTYFSKVSRSGEGVVVGGILTTAVLVLGVIGQYVGGRLADRFNKGKLFALSFTLSAPILFTLGLWPQRCAPIAAAIFAFLYFANQPVGNTLVMELSSDKFRGRAYGIYFFMNFGFGSFSATATGWIAERYGLGAIFPFLGAVLGGVAIMGWWLVFAMRHKEDLR